MKKILIVVLSLIPALSFAQDDFQSAEIVSTESMAIKNDYANNLKLREERRMGISTQVGGTAGLFGLGLELNIEDQDGAMIGAGFGSGYSTFTIGWKHSFEGTVFTPYTTLGWSRWYNSTGTIEPESHILRGMLTSDEIREGRFGLDLIVAGLGMQYQELGGEWAGGGFFGEMNLVASPFRGQLLPTAAVGATYLF